MDYNLDYIEKLYWFFAISGTFFFFLKSLMSVFTSFGDEPMLDDLGSEVSHDLSDSNQAFKTISIHSLTGFFMMFGWVGLACYKQYMLSSGLSSLIAFFAGWVMMMLISLIFKIAGSFVSQGSRFSLDMIKGKTAMVYHRIPSKGTGKIQISVDGLLREVPAISYMGKEIPSFTTVEVFQVLGDNTVSVVTVNK